MGMPPWAYVAGSLLGLDKLVAEPAANIYGLYKNIQNQNRTLASDQATKDVIDNLGWAQQEPDPKIALENLREVSRDASGRPLTAANALAVQGEIDKATKNTRADAVLANNQNTLQSFGKEAKDAGQDLVTYSVNNPDRVPWAALQTAHNVFGTMQQATEKEMVRRDNAAKMTDAGNFANAISGLTGRAQSPDEMARLKATGGYDPGGEADILAAYHSYPQAGEQALNQAMDNYRQTMEKTPVGAPFTRNIQSGNATAQELMQNYVLGGEKRLTGVTNHPKAAELGLAGWQNKTDKPKYTIITAEDGTHMRVNNDTGIAEPIVTATGEPVKKPPTGKKGGVLSKLLQGGNTPQPAGKTKSGKDYWMWPDGQAHYSPPPGK